MFAIGRNIEADLPDPIIDDPGDQVERAAQVPEDIFQCDTWAWKRRPEHKLAAPLSQLAPVGADDKTQEAIADWHYWLSHNYGF